MTLPKRVTADTLHGQLAALANPSRLAIVSLLAGRRGGETPSWVQEHLTLRLGQPTVSHHLRTLHAAGLVIRHEQTGVHVYYALSTSGLNRVVDALGRLQ